MTDSLRVLREIFQEVQEGKWSGFLLQIDQVKAFDKLDQGYLWKVLEYKGIPSIFIEYIRTLYRNAIVTPQINGWRTNGIPIRSGVRQGCPLSPLLYVLALDPVLDLIERDNRVRGIYFRTSYHSLRSEGEENVRKIQIEGRVKLIAHADDVIILTTNKKELEIVCSSFDRFGKASGAQLNVKKSFIYELDQNRARIRGGSLDKIILGSEEILFPSTSEFMETVKILGVYFSLMSKGMETNWELWISKLKEKVDVWKKWNLNMYQKAMYIKTYIMPMGSNLASVFLPTETIVKKANQLIFNFVWGTNFFPIPRIVAYKLKERGGLEVPAIGPIIFSIFVSSNFVPWGELEFLTTNEKEGQYQMWAIAFGNRWRDKLWGEIWWEKEMVKYKVTGHLKKQGPEFLEELYKQVKTWGIQSKLFKVFEEIQNRQGYVKHVKRKVYFLIMEGLYQQDEEKKQQKESLSLYLRRPQYPLLTFSDKRVPYNLWEHRWRAYHQVLNINTAKPWFGEIEQLCPRLECRKRANFIDPPCKETAEHFVKRCPSARKTWEQLSEELHWPTLKEQHWETIVSGLPPQNVFNGPIKSISGKKGVDWWFVPWTTVRLINLIVLLALSAQRTKEQKSQREQNIQQTVRFIVNRIDTLAMVEREKMSRTQWRKFWPWKTGTTPGIT